MNAERNAIWALLAALGTVLLAYLLTRPDLTMAQPAVINDVDDSVDPQDVRPFLGRLCEMVAEGGGALLFVAQLGMGVQVTANLLQF